jgi:hypothetical protein
VALGTCPWFGGVWPKSLPSFCDAPMVTELRAGVRLCENLRYSLLRPGQPLYSSLKSPVQTDWRSVVLLATLVSAVVAGK